ncbi:hypothetical protein R5R35_010750 [Gryllus longicercus]|uniref:Uncharacterized protein n=1 Tax=Gryllus longicercus TaxID=2509291 RepID=A0AAN9VEI8_9ORTH
MRPRVSGSAGAPAAGRRPWLWRLLPPPPPPAAGAWWPPLLDLSRRLSAASGGKHESIASVASQHTNTPLTHARALCGLNGRCGGVTPGGPWRVRSAVAPPLPLPDRAGAAGTGRRRRRLFTGRLFHPNPAPGEKDSFGEEPLQVEGLRS